MKWYGRFSFKTRVFLGCLLVALVPLTFSSVVVTRLFTASINRQLAMEGNRHIEEVSGKLTQLFENCEKACETFTADGTAARVMIDKDAIEMQKDLYLSLYQAVQEIYSSAQFSIYDSGGKLRFTTDTASKNSSLPIRWGLLKKAQGVSGITYYRTDPYLPGADKNIP
ncbi:MAG TPA: two-component sensor histidine kinase, partial [Clostridium sp.]|nr:two-component sensor histidine kinase [Clostridium sp.]